MKAHHEERRKHKRFPVLRELAEPVDIRLSPSPIHSKQPIPGVISNLSAGGMALIAFIPLLVDATIAIILDIPDLEKTKVEGKVVRREDKGGSYLHGIMFTSVPEKVQRYLNQMGIDYEECKIKLSLGLTDVCDKKCTYWHLCTKPVKIR